MTSTATEGRLTDEAIARMRRRIDIRQRSSRRPHNESVHYDGVRHFAQGNGDTNPLWSDRGYAAGTPWGDVIAPPLFAMACGLHTPVEWTPAETDAMSGGDPFRGVGQYATDEKWTFGAPLRIGTRVSKEEFLTDVTVREDSKFAGGVAVYLTYRQRYTVLGTDEVVTTCDRTFIYAERDKSLRKKRITAEELRRDYTPGDIEEIELAYAEEFVRGGQPLRHADVAAGDTLGTIVRGPLTITDIIGFHISWGFGDLFGVGALRMGHLNRQRIPRFYTPNTFGVPDAVQRCHWEEAQAQALGHPAPYDYGVMRTLWMVQLVTNWMGDSAQIVSLDCGVTKFNYVGDVQWISGTVTAVEDRPGLGPVAAVRVEGHNQRGESTCWAELEVLLPLDAAGTPRDRTV